MQLNIEDKHTAHAKAMAAIHEAFPEENEEFNTKFISIFNQGLNDSSMYNRAIRRLCTLSDSRVAPLLTEILKHQLTLQISVTERNKSNMSALDYASIHNPKAHAVIENSLRSVVAATTEKLLTGKSSAHTMTTAEQDSILDEAADEVFGGIDELLSEENKRTYAQSGPQQQFELCQNLAQQLVGNMQPTINKMRESMPAIDLSVLTSQNNFGSAVREITKNNPEFDALINLYNSGETESCLRWIAQKNHPQMMSILELFKKFNTTTFDINRMLNEKQQTPLHDAAINSNWGIYYALIGNFQANSLLPDIYGNSPATYRRGNFMNTASTSGIAGIAGEILKGVINAPQSSGGDNNPQPPECKMS